MRRRCSWCDGPIPKWHEFSDGYYSQFCSDDCEAMEKTAFDFLDESNLDSRFSFFEDRPNAKGPMWWPTVRSIYSVPIATGTRTRTSREPAGFRQGRERPEHNRRRFKETPRCLSTAHCRVSLWAAQMQLAARLASLTPRAFDDQLVRLCSTGIERFINAKRVG